MRNRLPIFLGVLLMIVAYTSWLVLTQARGNARQRSCVSNLTYLGRSLRQYCEDYDGRLPPNTPEWGWVDSYYTRFRNPDLVCVTAHLSKGYHQMPVVVHGEYHIVDYWFNSHLAGFAQDDIASPSRVYMFGDGNSRADKIDSRYSLKAFPSDWLTDKSMPPYRHNGGANYLFVDGHVKWLRPKELGKYTFEVR